MNRTQIARVLMILGTVLVSASSLLRVGHFGLDTAHASEWAPAPTPDKSKRLKEPVLSDGCDARYVAAHTGSNYIVPNDCKGDNYGKTCIRCNGKYMRTPIFQTPSSGDGVGLSITLSCGKVEEGRCTGRSSSCEDWSEKETSCGEVTDYGIQAIIDPPVDP